MPSKAICCARGFRRSGIALGLRQAQEQQRIAAARLAQVLHLDAAVELVAQDAELAPLALIETNAALDRARFRKPSPSGPN